MGTGEYLVSDFSETTGLAKASYTANDFQT